jgi:hypothetical protein
MGERVLGGALDGGRDAKQLVGGAVADRFGGGDGGSAARVASVLVLVLGLVATFARTSALSLAASSARRPLELFGWPAMVMWFRPRPAISASAAAGAERLSSTM